MLTDGGKEVQCGWLKDKFGLSWQVVPKMLPELLGNPNPDKAGRVMKAMLQMKKFDIERLDNPGPDTGTACFLLTRRP